MSERRKETEKERERDRERRGSETDVPKFYTYNEYELSVIGDLSGLLIIELLPQILSSNNVLLELLILENNVATNKLLLFLKMIKF